MARNSTSRGRPTLTGNVAGLDPGFVGHVLDAAGAAGATAVKVISGQRLAKHNADVGGVPRSNHLPDSEGFSHALDGYGLVGGQWIPLGELLKPSAPKYELRSGDVPGFYRGAPDPNHVDDGHNQPHGAGQAPASTPTTSSDPRSQFVSLLAQRTKLDPRVVAGWAAAEGGDAPGGTGGYDYLNVRANHGKSYSGVPLAGVSPAGFQRFRNPEDAATETAYWLNRMPNYSGVRASVGKGAQAQLDAIKSSPWDAGHYGNGLSLGTAPTAQVSTSGQLAPERVRAAQPQAAPLAAALSKPTAPAPDTRGQFAQALLGAIGSKGQLNQGALLAALLQRSQTMRGVA